MRTSGRYYNADVMYFLLSLHAFLPVYNGAHTTITSVRSYRRITVYTAIEIGFVYTCFHLISRVVVKSRTPLCKSKILALKPIGHDTTLIMISKRIINII